MSRFGTIADSEPRVVYCRLRGAAYFRYSIQQDGPFELHINQHLFALPPQHRRHLYPFTTSRRVPVTCTPRTVIPPLSRHGPRRAVAHNTLIGAALVYVPIRPLLYPSHRQPWESLGVQDSKCNILMYSSESLIHRNPQEFNREATPAYFNRFRTYAARVIAMEDESLSALRNPKVHTGVWDQLEQHFRRVPFLSCGQSSTATVPVDIQFLSQLALFWRSSN